MMDAASIAAALGGRRTGAGWVARCPAHPDRQPSLSIGRGRDGRLLLHCFAGCPFTAIVDALTARGIVIAQRAERRRPDALDREHQDIAGRIGRACAIWAAAGPATGTLTERYLRSRAVAHIPPVLRHADRLRHPSGAAAPAMIAPVVALDGRLRGVHRTWLSAPGRKADLDPPRAMLGPCAGAAVRLASGRGPLIVAEGIETALSLLDALAGAWAEERPRVWAALSASGVAGLALPADPGELVIAPDGDAAGAAAADQLAARALAEGWRVRLIPPPPGLDWNDVARQEAA